jgi:hypothetical protein
MSERCFKTAEELENKFLEYIDYCNDNERLPNVAGFARYAKINRDTFYAQEQYYSDTMKKINDILEDEALNNKYTNDTLKIFYMKNKCGYKDKQEIDNKVSVNNYANLSEEELHKLAGE